MDRKKGDNFVDAPNETIKNGLEGNVDEPVNFDDVLTNELGQFGRFQIMNTILAGIPLLMSAFMNEFVFSAAVVPHRCRIPECGETSKLELFEPEWISNAVPQSTVTATGFASCERFAPHGSGNGSLDHCPANLFDQFTTVACDGFVYARDNAIVHDFDLGCQDWLRALAGTFNNVGMLLSLPIAGYISDRFGRRFALLIGIFNIGLIGIIRAFSVNYIMYLILHILQATLGGGTFTSSYIIAAELVGPKYRVFTSATMTSMYALGQVTVGAVAWVIKPWRYLILALFIPCFLIISYYWILSESVRWLMSKQKFEEARKVLEKIARVNKTQISEKSMAGLLTSPPTTTTTTTSDGEKPSLIKSIFRSPILLRRVTTTPIWWVTTTFVYYGLSFNSTSLSDSVYLNYILTCGIEVPGFYTAVLTLDRIGRKATLSFGFFFSAACNIAFIFIPNDYYAARLVIFLLGKFSISTVMTSLYLYTSELYPTEFRHSLLAFSSMVGRIGAITAPLTPVLMVYWHGIPQVMFGSMAVLSGLLVLTQPETLGSKLPNTLAQAEALGRPESKVHRTS